MTWAQHPQDSTTWGWRAEQATWPAPAAPAGSSRFGPRKAAPFNGTEVTRGVSFVRSLPLQKMLEDVLKSAARLSATTSSHCAVTFPNQMIKWWPEIEAKHLPRAWKGSHLTPNWRTLGTLASALSSQNHKPSETDVTDVTFQAAGGVPCDLPGTSDEASIRWAG